LSAVRAKIVVASLTGAFALLWAPAPVRAYIYWSNGTTTGSLIARANLDGTGVNNNFMAGETAPSGVAVDGSHIYWVNRALQRFGPAAIGTIGRANLDGTGVNQSFITGITTPIGIAVDAGHVYWTDSGSAIGRASIAGTNVEQNFVTGAHTPVGIALDSGHIYWANDGDGTIGRASIAGTNVEQSFIAGAVTPYAIAVNSEHIYWDNFATPGGAIGRANLDGTNVNQHLIATEFLDSAGFAIDGAHMYWTISHPTSNPTIARANLDGTEINESFIRNTSIGPLAVDSLGPAASSAPVFGKTVGLSTVSGTVLIEQPGASSFVPLSAAASFPLGTTVDTTRGTVQLTSATGTGAHIQSGQFYSGIFRVTQRKAGSAVRGGRSVALTVLSLVGEKPSGCPAKGAKALAAGHRVRRLWGNAHGNFRTQGRYASATVRGTKWLTEDTCAGTLVKVARGIVSVTDFRTHRTVLVRAGKSFLARP
jgi:hypothetical protein